MSAAYLMVTLLAAGLNAWAACVDFARSEWVIANMKRYGFPQSWLFLLRAAKGGGAFGLLVGIAVAGIGVAASLGLVLNFLGAIATVVRSHCYSHLKYPTPFLLLAVASFALRIIAPWRGLLG